MSRYSILRKKPVDNRTEKSGKRPNVFLSRLSRWCSLAVHVPYQIAQEFFLNRRRRRWFNRRGDMGVAGVGTQPMYTGSAGVTGLIGYTGIVGYSESAEAESAEDAEAPGRPVPAPEIQWWTAGGGVQGSDSSSILNPAVYRSDSSSILSVVYTPGPDRAPAAANGSTWSWNLASSSIETNYAAQNDAIVFSVGEKEMVKMSPEGFFVGERKVTDDGEVHGLFRAWIKSREPSIEKG